MFSEFLFPDLCSRGSLRCSVERVTTVVVRMLSATGGCTVLLEDGSVSGSAETSAGDAADGFAPLQLELEVLIQRARGGCGASLGQLLNQFQPNLLGLADRALGVQIQKRMSRSDLVQDTMLSAARDFSGFHGHTGVELFRWLEQLLHSRLIEGLRKHRVAGKRSVLRESVAGLSGLTDPCASPSELISIDEECSRLMCALKTLPSDLQQVVNMHYLEQMSFAEIGCALGLSRATVWRKWMKAIECIQSIIMSDKGDDK